MSWAIWITGLPGSGKSLLARRAAQALAELNERVVVLELDEVRKTLTPAPTYSDAERDLVYRALVYMAVELTEAGVPVIVDATAHRCAWRDLARASIRHFAEVQLDCPLEVCREREHRRTGGHAPRGIYARAGAPGAAVPGVDVPYEPAFAPELTLDTAAGEPEAAAARIVALARGLAKDGGPPQAAPAMSWAIWITGLPGSGKSTLAWSTADALAARGIPVRVLELDAVRRFLCADRPESEPAREIIHRALAYTAKLLTEAGVSAIVDATAPRRAWRAMARSLIARFAEVQLVCPRELCIERERAVRWQLGGRAPVQAPARSGAAPAAAAPDLGFDYEHSLRPELILHTDVQDLWRAVEDVVQLVHRLRHREAP